MAIERGAGAERPSVSREWNSQVKPWITAWVLSGGLSSGLGRITSAAE